MVWGIVFCVNLWIRFVENMIRRTRAADPQKNIRLPLSFLYTRYKKVLNKSKLRELHIQEQGRLF